MSHEPWAVRCRCSPDSSRASPELSKASSSRARRPTDRQHMSTCRGVVSRLGAAAQASLRRRPVRQRTDALRSGTRYHSTYSMCRAQPLSVRGCRLPGSLYPGYLGTRCPVGEVEAVVRRETVLQRIDGACEEGMESVRYAARSEKRTAAIEARAASLQNQPPAACTHTRLAANCKVCTEPDIVVPACRAGSSRRGRRP